MSTTTQSPVAADAPHAVHNPRTGEVLYTFADATHAEVDAAYARARGATGELRALGPAGRARELRKLKQYMQAHKVDIARRISSETGKCLTDALAIDVFPVIDLLAYYERNAAKILSDRRVPTPLMLFGKKSRVFFEPLGPVLIIAPWNYPFHLSLAPAVCALAAGNPVIIKPSSVTPLRGLVEEIVQESGFPAGALQVVYASRRTADALIDAKPSKIVFTGSVGAGRKVAERAGHHLIPVELELGSKDAMVVFDDVHLERALNGALWGSMLNAGQTCIGIERIYVQRGMYDAFVDALTEKAQRLRTLANGENQDELSLDMGTMTPEFQIEEIEGQLAEAGEHGANIRTGGRRKPGSHAFPPTVVTDVPTASRLYLDECFGPVVIVAPFDDEDEVVRLVNDSPYGLSASVWSKNRTRALRIARRLHVGGVSINNVLATQANPNLPFGGTKDSGFGRYKGAEGLLHFCNIKSVLIDRASTRLEGYWYPYSSEKFGLLKELVDAVADGGIKSALMTAWIGLRLELLSRRKRL